MSNELTVTGQWSDNQKAIMKKTICNGLTDDEMAVFGHLCKHYNLDPFSKQIYAMKTGGKLATITGIDGLRLIAERTKCYAPGRDTEFLYQDNQLIGAKVYVKKRTEDGTWHEVSATAFIKEYAKQTSIWKSLAHVMIEKCFDDKTEILTEFGFQPLHSVTGKIMQVTESGLEPIDVKPWSSPYTGKMVEYDSQYLNFSVTPNHDMVTSVGRCEASVLLAFCKSRNHCEIPHISNNFKEDCDVSDSAIVTAAAFLCDGSACSSKSFRIKVSRKKKIDKLFSLNTHRDTKVIGKRNGIEKENSRNIRTQSDYVSFVYDFDSVSGLCDNKKDVDFSKFTQFSSRQAKLFVDSMLFFDGHSSNTAMRFYNSRSHLIGLIELCSLLAGYSVSNRSERSSDLSTKPNFSITISNRKSSPVFKLSAGHKIRQVYESDYSGHVWCVTVPSSTIVVRRNGYSMVCGNCAESRALRRCFPAQMSGLYTAEEMPERDAEIITVPSISFEEGEMLEKRLDKFPEYKSQLLNRCESLFGSPSFERLTREMFNNVVKKLEEMELVNENNQSVA